MIRLACINNIKAAIQKKQKKIIDKKQDQRYNNIIEDNIDRSKKIMYNTVTIRKSIVKHVKCGKGNKTTFLLYAIFNS